MSTTTNPERKLSVPISMITAELEGLYGSSVLEDMKNIIHFYDVFEEGAEFSKDSQKDYTPADHRLKSARFLIKKMARFMFSKTPDFFVESPVGDNKELNRTLKENSSIYKELIDRVLDKNHFSNALVKAMKDCLIGKRVALMYNINEDTGIQISFLPSLEFVYDVDPNDANVLTKIVVFYNLNTNKAVEDQRIYKKKFEMVNGYAHFSEKIYNGRGEVVEVIQEDAKTPFTFIPAWVIINDGLTGDLKGTSEIENLQDDESWYSRMSSADLDALRKGMNPIRYAIDADPSTTNNLSIAAGSFWDIASDQSQAEDRTAQVGVLDTPMSYSGALSTTLNRIKSDMYEQTSVPNVSPEALKGVVSSGKTLKAIYWDLIVLCDEKMLAWGPALRSMAECIIEGARMFPKVIPMYLQDKVLPDTPYTITVENQYPLPEDEADEKTIDLAEVNAQTMSRKSYMKKWRGLTEDEADEELRQIAIERELLENSYTPPTDYSNPPEENEDEEMVEESEE